MAANEPPPAPPSYPPAPVSPPSPDPQRRRQFLIGLAIGAVPLVVGMIGLGFLYSNLSLAAGTPLVIAGILYLLELVTMIILVSIQATRQVGLGILTALAADLVIFFVSCLVVLTHPRR